MTAQPLLGRVVVVAGDERLLADVAGAAADAGALVAVVSQSLPMTTPATVRFRAEPRDRDGWERIAMHIEQHLGPVDGVATDEATHDMVTAVFGDDLTRRGHGCVVTVRAGEDAESLVTRLCGMPPAAPSPPEREAPDR